MGILNLKTRKENGVVLTHDQMDLFMGAFRFFSGFHQGVFYNDKVSPAVASSCIVPLCEIPITHANMNETFPVAYNLFNGESGEYRFWKGEFVVESDENGLCITSSDSIQPVGDVLMSGLEVTLVHKMNDTNDGVVVSAFWGDHGISDYVDVSYGIFNSLPNSVGAFHSLSDVDNTPIYDSM